MAERKGRRKLDDVGAAREPLFGLLASFSGIGLVVAAPIWAIVMAMVHTELIRQTTERVILQDGLMVDEAGQMVTRQDVYWSLLVNPWLVANSMLWSTAVVLVLMLLLIAGVLTWQLAVRALAPMGQRRANRRYHAMVDGEIELTKDAWTKNLPVPEPEPPEPADAEALRRQGLMPDPDEE